MRFSSMIRSIFKSNRKKPAKRGKPASVNLEHLEERLAPYSPSGGAWPNPQVITISFMPDGTELSSAVGSPVTSNLFSTFNAKFGSAAAWENQILKAAQVWAQQTNINFVVVPDNGAPSGSGNYEQGNPGFGDVRIGGYVFGNSTLANSYYPPQVNNYSIAGDIVFNTGQTFNIGSTYDLFTVAAHEFGHALGLGESSSGANAVMYASYTGIKSALAADDVAGIQNIYSNNGPRTGGASNTLATATNIGSLISSTSLTALDSNLNLATTADTDWYTFTAPTGTSSSMTVQVQSQGLSLLTPKVTVYAANGTTVLGAANGLNKYQGSILDVTVTGVTAGTHYYVKVQGADTTAFSTGDYALALKFGTAATPVEASPIIESANGNPLTGGGGVADDPAGGNSYLDSVPVITGITPDNGASSSDNITNTPTIALVGSAPASNIVQVFQQTSNGLQYVGATQANNQNQWSWTYTGAPLTSGDYTFYAVAVDNYSGIQSSLSSPGQVIIDTSAPSAPTVSVNNPATGAPLVFSNVTTPVVAGTAGANDAISVYVDGNLVAPASGATWTTMACSNGAWSFTLPSALSSGVHTVTATAMTVAGNTGPASTPYTLLVTSSAVNTPVILGMAPASVLAPTVFSDIVNTNTISIGGLADDNATVNLYQSSGGSNPIFLGSVVANNTGQWLYNDGSAPLNAGAYSFSANEVVAAGASPTSQGFSATIDASTPATPVISGLQAASTPASGMPPAAPPAHILLGTAPAGDAVNVFLNGHQVGSTTADAQGNWSFNFAGLTLQSGGNNAFTVQAVDVGGNGSGISQAFNVTGYTAAASPTVTALSPAYSGYSTGLTNSLSAGNLAACFTNSLTPTISGTAPANSYVELFNNTTYVGYTTANSSGKWSFTTPSLQNTIYNFTAVAITANGVASASSNPIRFIVSTQPPPPPTIQTIASNPTNSQQIVLSGIADPNTTVNIYVGGTLAGKATVNSSGNWTFDYNSRTLLLGIYSFQVTETNLAGNTSKASEKLDITINLLILGLSLGL